MFDAALHLTSGQFSKIDFFMVRMRYHGYINIINVII
jgi:hypothetical protein